MPATSTFRISCTCAWCARPMRAWAHRVDRRRGGAGAAGRGRGVDQCRHRGSVADRFPRRQVRRRRSSHSASRRWRATACAMSAIRSRRCSPRTPISPRTRPSWSTVEIEELPVVLSASDPPGEFEPGRSSEAAICCATATATSKPRSAPRTRSSSSICRPAGTPACRWRRAARIGRYDAARDILELHGAAKIPHRNRETLCRMLGRSPSRAARAREPCRRRLRHPRRNLSRGRAGAARRACGCGRPVKWIEDRREHLMCANQSASSAISPASRSTRTACILGIEDEIFHDQGAYIRTHGVNVPNRTMCMLTGCYRVPAYRALAHVRLTNKTPAATYRAPGRFESTFVRSRLMDAVADRLGLDRIEVRRRNLIAASRDALHHRVRRAGRRGARARFRRLCRAARQGARRVRLGEAAAGPRSAAAPHGEAVGAGHRDLPRRERARADRQCQDRGRHHAARSS